MNYKESFLYCDDSLPLKMNKKVLLNIERAGYYVRLDEVPDDGQFLDVVCHSLVLRYWGLQRQTVMQMQPPSRKVKEA